MKKAGKAHKAAKQQRAAKHRAKQRHAKDLRRPRRTRSLLVQRDERPLGAPSPAAVEAMQFFEKHRVAPFAALEQLVGEVAPDGLWHIKIAAGIEHVVDGVVRDELIRRIAPVVFPQKPVVPEVAPVPPADSILPVL